jgi:hypothetical protein
MPNRFGGKWRHGFLLDRTLAKKAIHWFMTENGYSVEDNDIIRLEEARLQFNALLSHSVARKSALYWEFLVSVCA